MNHFNKIICMLICITLVSGISASASTYTSNATEDSLEKKIDDYMQTVLDHNVAGAAVSIVKDGNVLLSKGYGYADLGKSTPVDADATCFQIASISKVFTSTAVMQMVEQGKLSLDEDVNHYLTAFKVENPYPEPVTLRTLLTHTSGLDFKTPLLIPTKGDYLFESLDSLEENLIHNLPSVIRRPGTFCQYNGYGIALAGYLVEIASGIPLDQYITENIMEPLSMCHSSYGLTQSIIPNISKPYNYMFGKYFLHSYTLVGDHPVGSICASASDMANFMLMHLNNGELNGSRILTYDTASEMRAHQYPEDERITGFSLGFCESVRKGYSTYEFGGYLPCFSSKMSLLPDENMGIFIEINTNSKNSGTICNDYIDYVYSLFIEKNGRGALSEPSVPFDMDVKVINGRYSFSEYGENDFSKLKSLLITCKVKCDESGYMTFSGGNIDMEFRYVGKGVFFCDDYDMYCCFPQVNGRQAINILGFDYFRIEDTTWIVFILSMVTIPIFVLFIMFYLLIYLKKYKKVSWKIRSIQFISIIESLLITSFYGLNGLAGYLYLSGSTALIFQVIEPAIFLIGRACMGVGITAMILMGKILLRNKAEPRIKTAYSMLISLYIPNILLMYQIT